MENELSLIVDKKNILKFTQTEVNKSNLIKYKPETVGPFLSLDHVPLSVKDEIVPVINYGLKLSSVSNHLQVPTKVLSKYLKDMGFHWVIEYKSYLDTENFVAYKNSKIKTVTKSLKNRSKISLTLSTLANNLVEMHRYSYGKTVPEAINSIIESTCSPESRKMAEKFTVVVKAKDINKN